jgi:2,3-dihydroxyphenylpropionate 1,2-dioxygenase
MTAAIVCASHTPLMNKGPVDPATAAAVVAGFAGLAGHVRQFAPDLVIQFSPDHFNGFFYDLMPGFCIGAAAASVGDWGTGRGALPVPQDLALALADAVVAAEIDVALSYRMKVDHGFVQIWEALLGRTDAYPMIPVFVNCAAPPLPRYRRARLLGAAVGRFAASTGKRVLFAASGGLSHDPPTPDIRSAPEDVRERLIAGRDPPPEARRLREERVLAVGQAAARGEGPCLPPDPCWDREFLCVLRSADLSLLDAYSPERVREQAGRGGNEVLTWVAAMSALSEFGPYATTVDFYAAIPGWIAGMAMLSGRTLGA